MDRSFATSLAEISSQGGETSALKLSEQIWQLNWRKILPFTLHSDGIIAEVGTYQELCSFAKENFQSIYEQDPQNSKFLVSEMTPGKATYYNSVVDICLFRHRGRVVGMYTCNPTDWSSYYMRNCSILPEYQGKRLFQTFLALIIDEATKAGVTRIDTDVSPANLANIHVLNKNEFNITAMQLSERWGSLLRLTKFLNEKNSKIFLDQFCWGVFHQLKTQKERRTI